MNPENLIAGTDTFRLKIAPGIEASDHRRPGVSALDARNELLTDAEPRRDFLLHHALSDQGSDLGVAPVQVIHAGALTGDNLKGSFQFLGLDDDVGPQAQEQPLNIWGVGNGVAEQPPVSALLAPSIFFHPTVSEAGADRVQDGAVGIREADADAAFVLVAFDAAFSVEKASDVAVKGFFGPLFHALNITRWARIAMAVPVVRWIMDRMRASMAQQKEAAR